MDEAEIAMNERVKQLMGQTLDEQFSHTWTTMTYQDLETFSNKFAELIVRECAEIADTERSNSVGCGYITKTNGMRIKEHFGVEE
jgi:hypothetical protein